MNEHKHCNCKKEEKATYAFFSRVLNKPFDSVAELKAAEEAYYAEIKAKEDKAATKKADAKKVEDAFKVLNAARKSFKEDLAQITEEYSTALADTKKAFEAGKADIYSKLATAEDTYSKALKEFTDKYDTYHLSLKDGDFETTISGNHTVSKSSGNKADSKKEKDYTLDDLFDLLFNF